MQITLPYSTALNTYNLFTKNIYVKSRTTNVAKKVIAMANKLKWNVAEIMIYCI